jgi:epoxyqueuosine reductase
MNDITQQIEAQARALGFHAVGIAAIEPNSTQAAARVVSVGLSGGDGVDV